MCYRHVKAWRTQCHTESNNFTQAEFLLRKLLTINAIAYEDNHAYTLNTINKLAEALEALHRLPEAVTLCEASL